MKGLKPSDNVSRNGKRATNPNGRFSARETMETLSVVEGELLCFHSSSGSKVQSYTLVDHTTTDDVISVPVCDTLCHGPDAKELEELQVDLWAPEWILSDTEVTMCNVQCCRLERVWCCSSCAAVQEECHRLDRHGIATLLYTVVDGKRPSKKQEAFSKNHDGPENKHSRSGCGSSSCRQGLQPGWVGMNIRAWTLLLLVIRWIEVGQVASTWPENLPDFIRHSPVVRLPKSCSASSIA